MQVNTQEELDLLFKQTNFAADKAQEWHEMKITPNTEYPLGSSIYVPQCTYFGGTMICLADTYERHGEDCLFLQELMRLYQEGKLKVQES